MTDFLLRRVEDGRALVSVDTGDPVTPYRGPWSYAIPDEVDPDDETAVTGWLDSVINPPPPPAPTLEDHRRAAITNIKTWDQERRFAPVTHPTLGTVYAADEKAIGRIKSRKQLWETRAEVDGVDVATMPMPWIDINYNQVELTWAEFIQLGLEVGMQHDYYEAMAALLISEVMKAESKAEINTILTQSGIPTV